MTNAYNRTTGRQNDAQSAIMKVLRPPVLVDNAVHHAQYEKVQAGYRVKPPTKGDFQPTHDRRYELVEEEDGVRILHKTTDGHRFTGSAFFHDRQLTNGQKPPLILFSETSPQHRLAPKQVVSATTGSRLTLQNLDNRNLESMGFPQGYVRLGQKVGVGLRSSDLALKVLSGPIGGLNSITTPRQQRKIHYHSTTFVSHNFRGVDAVSASRFLSKHDMFGLHSDRFGNLSYSRRNSVNREHLISPRMVTGGTETDSISHVPNRVVVRGTPRADNDQNVVVVDDIGLQGGDHNKPVNEAVGGIHVPTAKTAASARRIGQRFLAGAKKASGKQLLRGVHGKMVAQPGERAKINNSESVSILRATHHLHDKVSDIQVKSLDSGISDILQRLQEQVVVNNSDVSFSNNEQIQSKVFSTGDEVDIKTTWMVTGRTVLPQGIIINHPRRGVIHGKSDSPVALTKSEHVIGTSKYRGYIQEVG